MTHRVTVKVTGLQPVQVLAGIVAALFIALGVVGFVRTGMENFLGDQHAYVLGFAVNPLHNIIHLATGVLGLLMVTRSSLARVYGWILLVAYGALFAWGLALTGVLTVNPVAGAGNPLALGVSDNWLHLGVALVGLLLAALPARRKVLPLEKPEEESHQQPESHQEVPEPRIEQMDPTVPVSPRPKDGACGPAKDRSTGSVKA